MTINLNLDMQLLDACKNNYSNIALNIIQNIMDNSTILNI